VTDELRPLWDFDDLEASEKRFRDLLAKTEDGGERAEVLTQLARIEGLRGSFGAGEQLIREAGTLAGSSPRARIRIDLERGRLLRSGGDSEAALPHFERAAQAARELDELFIAADAAHMAAITASTPEARLAWTGRGIELAESGDGSGAYWLGPLLNNLGWDQHGAGRYDDALETFRRALAARERDPENPQAIAVAHYAVAKALQALGRHGDAVAELERADAIWTASEGTPDGYSNEALAESYDALGRAPEAAEHARRALKLLAVADPSFEADSERVDRLTALAARER
jgi:tetratricopeptide (TPR) repeat protein